MLKRFTLLGLTLSLLFSTVWAEEVYFGNLHSHTAFSDGSGTPEQAYRHAKDVAGLDFLAITEHNHAWAESGAKERRDKLLISDDPELYNSEKAYSLVKTAQRRTKDGEFVAIYGQEFSSISQGNHVNVFEIGEVLSVPNGKFDELLEYLDTNADSTDSWPLIQLNHPDLYNDKAKEYGRDDFVDDAAWITALDKHAQLIEVLNGPAMAKTGGNKPAERSFTDYLHFLNMGFHLAPTANQDNHYFTWGTSTDARTAVIADELTKEGILDALKERHVYATEDKNLRIICKHGANFCGDIINTSENALDIELLVSDDDEPSAGYQIEVYYDEDAGGPLAHLVEDIELETEPGRYVVKNLPIQPGAYFLFEITQINEHGGQDKAWTAPIWISD